MYDLNIHQMTNEEVPPLWTNKQKMNQEFPIYKYIIETSIHIIDESNKLSKKENWQTIKLNSTNEHSFAESILALK